jgi:hypothetical protein
MASRSSNEPGGSETRRLSGDTLITEITAVTAPDVFLIPARMWLVFAKLGLILNLSENGGCRC